MDLSEFWSSFVSYFSTGTIQTLLNVVWAVVLLIVGLKLVKWLLKQMDRGRPRYLEAGVYGFFRSFLGIALRGVVIITAGTLLGVPLTAIVTLVGSAGLAVGLALQGSLANFAGGVMILLFKPFVVGDFIDKHSDSGHVMDIGIFYTTLLTLDNRRVMVPNGTLSNASIVNWSALPTRRIDMEFTASYDSDIDHVARAMLLAANGCEHVLKDPPPVARLLREEDSALCFLLRFWCKSEDYWAVTLEMEEAVYRAFKQNGIVIPYPQLDAHIKAD